MCQRFNLERSIVLIGICAAVQGILAAPFLLAHPLKYIAGAFDLSRVRPVFFFNKLKRDARRRRNLALSFFFCNSLSLLLTFSLSLYSLLLLFRNFFKSGQSTGNFYQSGCF